MLVQSAGKAWSAATRQTIRSAWEELVASRPADAATQRAFLAALPYGDPAWKPTLERLLALKDVVAADFTRAAYQVAQAPDGAETAKELLKRAQERFPEEESVHRMAGWSLINLNDHPAALAAFRKTQTKLANSEKPDADLLCGLVITRWITGDKSGAVADYQRLMETGRASKKPEDWADPATVQKKGWPEAKKKPLLETLAETLRQHPELKTSARTQEN